LEKKKKRLLHRSWSILLQVLNKVGRCGLAAPTLSERFTAKAEEELLVIRCLLLGKCGTTGFFDLPSA
jgi:hypothetical protein